MKYTDEQKKNFIKEIMKKINDSAPCFEGDMIHIYMREGCYKVSSITNTGFFITLKGVRTFLTWSQYRCHKGQGVSMEARVNRLRRVMNW